MKQPTYALTKISEHTSRYRGFCITKTPRQKRQRTTCYHVMQGDISYGKFDAQAQATSYIDYLYSQRGL